MSNKDDARRTVCSVTRVNRIQYTGKLEVYKIITLCIVMPISVCCFYALWRRLIRQVTSRSRDGLPNDLRYLQSEPIIRVVRCGLKHAGMCRYFIFSNVILNR